MTRAQNTPQPTDDKRRRGYLTWVTQLVRAHRSALVGLARRSGLDGAAALDAVQEAFFTFLTLPDADHLAFQTEVARQVLSAIVVNHSRNTRRAVSRFVELDEASESALSSTDTSAETLIARAEERVALVRCLDRLGRIQRAVVQLRLLEERPGEEVTELLGLSSSNVRVLLHRARAELKVCLDLSLALDGVP